MAGDRKRTGVLRPNRNGTHGLVRPSAVVGATHRNNSVLPHRSSETSLGGTRSAAGDLQWHSDIGPHAVQYIRRTTDPGIVSVTPQSRFGTDLELALARRVRHDSFAQKSTDAPNRRIFCYWKWVVEMAEEGPACPARLTTKLIGSRLQPSFEECAGRAAVTRNAETARMLCPASGPCRSIPFAATVIGAAQSHNGMLRNLATESSLVRACSSVSNLERRSHV